MNVPGLITGTIVGALAALLVRELNQFGLALADWSLAAPRVGEALLIGALVGMISQIFAQKRASR
ncbi:hypothetical protein QH494_00055 [Sphingomonas sp. AR_OL41]|uniref:hypothetical protein n=1 Tax=Sphingomonas sp. AR_OL41 TaxID=3042729 RepID=UPI0024805B0B|nr:hypothetical protein [Sphingomonas sp. AR_OL41]MDH7970565.1 hypothetical protein [Sphingomonas sp. AR_OL41]